MGLMLFKPNWRKKSIKVTPHRLERNYTKKSSNHIEMYLISLNPIEEIFNDIGGACILIIINYVI